MNIEELETLGLKIDISTILNTTMAYHEIEEKLNSVLGEGIIDMDEFAESLEDAVMEIIENQMSEL